MSGFDTMAKRFADEIRVAAKRNRSAESRGQKYGNTNIAFSPFVAMLRLIAQEIENLTYGDTNEPIPDHDKECIVRRTAQQLGLDPIKLHAALRAISAGNPMPAIQSLELLNDD